MTDTLSAELAAKRDQLLGMIRSFGSCAVAFSAGVDSAVVAKAAALALGDRAVAVTGVSASLAEGELEQAREMAQLIGIRHLELQTDELAQPQYAQNAPDRCYHCKTELYLQMKDLQGQLDVAVLLNGANADDLFDYRPGTQAAAEQQVCSPLADCQLTKAEVRQLAQDWGLPVWNKPATPCLSSRLAYGEEVTAERLAMVDRAEQFLRARGFATCRVRYHRGDMARVEVPVEQLSVAARRRPAAAVGRPSGQLGFKFVTSICRDFGPGASMCWFRVEQLTGDV